MVHRESNPVAKKGYVYDINDKWVYIMWSNGISNTYLVKDEDLVVVGKGEFCRNKNKFFIDEFDNLKDSRYSQRLYERIYDLVKNEIS